jgi:PKD repeat protein
MRRRLVVIVTLVGVLTAVLPAAAGAAVSAPLPSSMAAVGDSITQAASTGGSLGADYPANSWSTGTNSTVNSHFLRLRALNPSLSSTNNSVSGAKVADLPGQMQRVAALEPDPGYLTVLIGGNDLCTSTVGTMTSVDAFRASFTAAMETITTQSSGTYVYVVSIPDVYQLWELFRNNWWARTVWALGGVCQSLLANPTSNQAVDVQRRAAVRQRNIDFNTVLREVCESAAFASRCRFDGNAAFNTRFTTSDVSGDYFHPSLAGQAKLASVSWSAGYTWTTTPTNAAPTASFAFSCTDLTCSFTDTSIDTDGTVVAWQWSFGDGMQSVERHPTWTYGTGGTYPVSLTVTDNGGATHQVTQQVAVSQPPPPPAATMSVATLDGTSAATGRNTWAATVTITLLDEDGAPVSGAAVSAGWSVGAADTCITGAAGACSVVSDNLNVRKVSTVTLTVLSASHSSYTYVDPPPAAAVMVERPA